MSLFVRPGLVCFNVLVGADDGTVDRDTGTVVSMGDDRASQGTVPDGVNMVKGIAAGRTHTLVITGQTGPERH